MNMTSTMRYFFLLLLGTGVFLTPGCGGDSETTDLSGYHLDPPELAVGGFPPIEDGVPVLCYHYFRSGFDGTYLMKVLGSVLFGMPALGPREFWTTPVGEFEKHLRYFRDSGTTVMTLDEVADLLESGADLPVRAVVLTIDDADRSVYELAYPLLRKYGMKAHLFVPTAKVGSPWSDLDICTWEQLREMVNSGHIIVESHTRDLHYKVRAGGGLEPVFLHPDRIPEQAGDGLSPLTGPNAAVAEDLVSSRVDIEAGVGTSANWLAWPYGFATDELDSLSRKVGFRGTVSLYPEAFTVRDTTLQVGRFALTAKSTISHIANIFPR
ncbi:MAG: polysaccharide deacetylase family protein [Candidatus Krumholzibacteria bacterium]|nr:polysaccharide deacetylase family protein [Candidatus Krumholzibacteria bacterium]